MSKKRPDNVQSTICNTCDGSGKKPVKKQAVIKDGKNAGATYSQWVEETCPTCNGLGDPYKGKA